MTTAKSELRAMEYRARAKGALAASEACTLDRAREQHELAALRWNELAEAEEIRALSGRTSPANPISEADGASLETNP